jgi:hypothetical protein
MPLDDGPVLPYEVPRVQKPRARGFPWGTLSLTLGISAAFAVPLFDSVTQVPGFVQSPILITGMVSSWLAIGSGIGAAFVRSERTRGLIGACLGFAGSILWPTLARI